MKGELLYLDMLMKIKKIIRYYIVSFDSAQDDRFCVTLSGVEAS